jgi:signal transduction histidine kinase
MEPGILKQARQQLAARLAVFTTGLIFIFALQSSNQLRENARTEQQRQLELLGQMAANRLAEMAGGQPGPQGAKPSIPMGNSWGAPIDTAGATGSAEQTGSATETDAAATAGSREAGVRVLWIGPQMNIVDEYGSFVPGGSLVPPQQSRLQPQSIQLSNGAALWLPVHTRVTADSPRRLLGYVAIASSEAPGSRTALISLLSATAASVILALLGIPWILERSLQPLREQINRLRQFAGDVAHELRNPMMALQTSLANARDVVQHQQRGSGPTLDALRPLNTITTRMASILDDILLLTNLESGTDDAAEPSIAIDSADLFDELAVLHDSEARSRQVQLVFEVESPVQLTLVPARAQRILSNLITNAIRFTARDGTVRVIAAVQGAFGVIRVDDEGPGIPKEDQQRVFQRLVQLEPGCNHSHRGLGLALCRSLVQLHGGNLDVQQSPAGGCRMQWSWPLEPDARRRWTLPRAGYRR